VLVVSKNSRVDLEVQQVRAREEHRLLDLALRIGLDEQIHRAIRLVFVHRLKTGDVNVLAGPFRRGEL